MKPQIKTLAEALDLARRMADQLDAEGDELFEKVRAEVLSRMPMTFGDIRYTRQKLPAAWGLLIRRVLDEPAGM